MCIYIYVYIYIHLGMNIRKSIMDIPIFINEYSELRLYLGIGII